MAAVSAGQIQISLRSVALDAIANMLSSAADTASWRALMADVIRHPGGADLPLLALAAELSLSPPRKCCRWPWHARWMKMHWRGEPLRRCRRRSRCASYAGPAGACVLRFG